MILEERHDKDIAQEAKLVEIWLILGWDLVDKFDHVVFRFSTQIHGNPDVAPTSKQCYVFNQISTLKCLYLNIVSTSGFLPDFNVDWGRYEVEKNLKYWTGFIVGTRSAFQHPDIV